MPQAPPQPAGFIPAKKQVVLGLITVFTIYFTASFFMQTLGVARPRMAADLDGMALYSWAISIPGLAGAFVTLIFSKFSDIYGRRLILLVSLIIFLGGTILCAVSPTFEILIVANTIARFGSGALAPLCFSVLGDMFPPARRSKWIGLLNIPAGTLALIGPTLSGWLVDNWSWRYVYWIGVPLIAVCMVTVPIGLPSLVKGAARKIDVRGTIFMMAASTTMVFALSFAGTTYPWASVQVIGLLIVSLVFWALFFRTEGKADEPILDPQVLYNRIFLILIVSGLLSNFGLTGIIVFYPLFLQGVQGLSATLSGQIITPYNVLMAFMGVPTGFLLARVKRYKWMFVLSYALLTVVMFRIVFFTADTPILWTVLAATLGGLGLGAVPTMKTLIVQCAVPKRLLAVATGGFFFSVSIGLTIAPAVLGSVLNVAYAGKLRTTLPAELQYVADEAMMTSLGNPRVLLSAPAMTDLRETFDKREADGQALYEQTVQAIRTSMETGLRAVFSIGAVAMLLALLLILALPEISIDTVVPDKRDAMSAVN